MSPLPDSIEARGLASPANRRLTPRQVWERAAEIEFAGPGGFTGLPLLRARSSTKSSAMRERQRATVDERTWQQVRRMDAAGKTGAEISKQLGISLPSVQNLKKKLTASDLAFGENVRLK